MNPPRINTLTGRKRKEINYNEERVIPAIDSDDEGTKGGGAKKGRTAYLTPKVLPGRQPLPTRRKDLTYNFADHPEFKPNLSPKEVCMRVCLCLYARASIDRSTNAYPSLKLLISMGTSMPGAAAGLLRGHLLPPHLLLRDQNAVRRQAVAGVPRRLVRACVVRLMFVACVCVVSDDMGGKVGLG